MADTRPVPTNLDSWPGVADLVNDYKHMLHVLWSSPSDLVGVVGVGKPGIIERLCSATNYKEPVILEALREFERRRLVVLDEDTREVAIRGWVRYHKFAGRWAQAAQQAYNKIVSAKIKAVLVKDEGVKSIFPEKSKCQSPNTNHNSNINPTPLTPRPQAGDADPPGGGSEEGEEDRESEKDNPQAGQGVGVEGLDALERLQPGLTANIIPLIVNLPLRRAQALVDRLVGDMREGGVKRPVDLINHWIRQGDAWSQSPAGAAVAKAREAEARHQAALAAQPQIDERVLAIGKALLPPNLAARAAEAQRTAGIT